MAGPKPGRHRLRKSGGSHFKVDIHQSRYTTMLVHILARRESQPTLGSYRGG